MSRVLEATAELFYTAGRGKDQFEVSFALLLFFEVGHQLDVLGGECLKAFEEGRKRNLLLASRFDLDAAFVRQVAAGELLLRR